VNEILPFVALSPGQRRGCQSVAPEVHGCQVVGEIRVGYVRVWVTTQRRPHFSQAM
jgi:hypothetical protein